MSLNHARRERPLRLPRRAEARQIAELIVIAGDSVPDFPLDSQANNGSGPIDLAKRRTARKAEAFSFRHAVIAEALGEMAGMVLGYRVPVHGEAFKLTALPRYLRPISAIERTAPGSFYINTLAVFPQFQNLGLGALLLEAASERARKGGCDSLTLEVAEHNEAAIRFYLRHRFQFAARRASAPGDTGPYAVDIALLRRAIPG